VTAQAATQGGELTLETVKAVLRDILRQERRRTLSIDGIQKLVAEHFDVPLGKMIGKGGAESIVFPRQVAMYLCHRGARKPLKATCEAFGGCREDAVQRACRLVKERMKAEVNVRQVVGFLKKQLTH